MKIMQAKNGSWKAKTKTCSKIVVGEISVLTTPVRAQCELFL